MSMSRFFIKLLVVLFFVLFGAPGFGAEIIVTPSGGDDTARINAALRSLDPFHTGNGQSVRLDGTAFFVCGQLNIPALQGKLHGNGRGQTAIFATCDNFTMVASIFPGGEPPAIGRVELSDLSLSANGHAGVNGWDIEGGGNWLTVPLTYLTDVLVNQVSTYGMAKHATLKRVMNAQLMGDQVTGGVDGLSVLDSGMLNIIAWQSYGMDGQAIDIEATPNAGNHSGEGVTADGIMINGAKCGMQIGNVGSVEIIGMNISSVTGNCPALHLVGYTNGGHVSGQVNALSNHGVVIDTPDPVLGGVANLTLDIHAWGNVYGMLIQPGSARDLIVTGNFHDQSQGGSDIVDAGCLRCVFHDIVARSAAGNFSYIQLGGSSSTLRGLRSIKPFLITDATTLSLSSDNHSGL